MGRDISHTVGHGRNWTCDGTLSRVQRRRRAKVAQVLPAEAVVPRLVEGGAAVSRGGPATALAPDGAWWTTARGGRRRVVDDGAWWTTARGGRPRSSPTRSRTCSGTSAVPPAWPQSSSATTTLIRLIEIFTTSSR